VRFHLLMAVINYARTGSSTSMRVGFHSLLSSAKSLLFFSANVGAKAVKPRLARALRSNVSG
jgi:hypothetical protein